MSPAKRNIPGSTRSLVWTFAALLITSPAAWAGVSVSLTAPANGSVHASGGNITVSASASADQGYTVSKVEFFQGTTLIGTDTSSPYGIVWNGVPSGNYSITAKATAIKKNSPNQTGTSSPSNIVVTAPPVVTLTNPTNEQTIYYPATVNITATATDPDGTVAYVDFYADGCAGEQLFLGRVTQPPYVIANWDPFPMLDPYCYSVWAVATDNYGITGPQNTVLVYVVRNTVPTVNVVSPVSNATFDAPASILLEAQATDSDGSIVKVEFFHGTTLITTLTAAPYLFAWTGVPQGGYVLTAKATDNLGAVTTSPAVNVTVNAAIAQLHFIHADHLNTPRLVANQSGQTVWRWDQQEPFGVSVPDENPSGLGAFEFPLRFPGQYADKETNLHYNMARNYWPDGGSYVEADRLGIATTWPRVPTAGLNHLYAYVGSAPLAFIDPWGEQRLWRRFNPRHMEELQRNLPEYMIEQGGKAATGPEDYGVVVGKYLCKATGGKVRSGFDACSLGGPFGGGCGIFLSISVEAHQDCIDACRNYIKKACNPNCPP